MNKQTAVYWFRNDLRLSDNKALTLACQQSAALVLVYCLAADEQTHWGFDRVGQHRKTYLADTILCLAKQCETLGSQLFVVAGDPKEQLPAILRLLDSNLLYCEDIAAPEEISQVDSLRRQGFQVHASWQSSLFFPEQLPFTPDELPLVFTTFRKQVEQAGCLPLLPLPAIKQLPAVPLRAQQIQHIVRSVGAGSASELAKELVAEKHTERPNSHLSQLATALKAWAGEPQIDERSSYPYYLAKAQGGEIAAMRHVKAYFAAGLAHHYKETRNGLIGFDYSTKLSPWLAQGAVSARQVYEHLTLYEAAHGANDSTYWIWFELLWRDYFRFLHLRFGKQLYQATGLLDRSFASPPTRNQRATSAKYATSYGPAALHQPELFDKWCQGNTGQPLIDAGMRELAATGYLSNRMRQIVASYLIHDLQCDWRSGAAWFEAQLVDYDVYSNQGNWLYLAGYGTDPRTDRRFNLDKQQKSYDPKHSYTQLWLS